MQRKQFTEEQIIRILHEAEALGYVRDTGSWSAHHEPVSRTYPNTALTADWQTFEDELSNHEPDLLIEDFLINHGYLAKDFWQRQPPEPPRKRSELDDADIPF